MNARLVVGLLLLAACEAAPTPAATAGDLAIFAPRAPAPPDTAVAAIYLTFHNAGSEPDTLVGATSGVARAIRVHGRGMVSLPVLVLPAGQSVRLEPGGTHFMLERLTRPLVAGDTIMLTLTLRRAGVVRVAVPVVRYEDLVS